MEYEDMKRVVDNISILLEPLVNCSNGYREISPKQATKILEEWTKATKNPAPKVWYHPSTSPTQEDADSNNDVIWDRGGVECLVKWFAKNPTDGIRWRKVDDN